MLSANCASPVTTVVQSRHTWNAAAYTRCPTPSPPLLMRLRLSVLASALQLCVVPGAVVAQPSPAAALDTRVDSVFAAFNRTSTPGCGIGVDRAGVPLVRRAYGMANLETGTPFSRHTISESGSTAKQFVAAALVMLARDGTLSLDDDVSRWVPEVKAFGARITVRQLLSHTSGIPDRYALHDVQGRAAGETDHTNAEVLDVVAHLHELNFAPGEDYLYSNTGYVVAVAVLERASGMSLQAFTQARIFAPLGMTSTRWREDHRVVVPDRASAYSRTASGEYRNEHPFTRVFGSGGLLLTIDDFLAWSNALQTGAGAWGAIRDSLEAVVHLNDGTALTYGLGIVSEQWRGVRRVSHTGATGGYRAAIFRFPQQAVSIALLCNVATANTTLLGNAVAAIVLGDALQAMPAQPAPAIAMSTESMSVIAGRYRAPRTDDLLVLEVRNGTLVDSLTGTVLVPLGNDRFRTRAGEGTVTVARSGSTVTLRTEAPNTRAVDYARVESPLVSSDAYVGRYRSAELDGTLSVVMRDGSLRIDDGFRGTRVLTPLLRDGFALPGGERLRFTRDARGRVDGATLWAGRVQHLRFVKAAAAR